MAFFLGVTGILFLYNKLMQEIIVYLLILTCINHETNSYKCERRPFISSDNY